MFAKKVFVTDNPFLAERVYITDNSFLAERVYITDNPFLAKRIYVTNPESLPPKHRLRLSEKKERGRERSTHTNTAVDVSIPLPKNNVSLSLTSEVELELIYIPAGEFLMGLTPKKQRLICCTDYGERSVPYMLSLYPEPEHDINLSEYWIVKYPTTVQQFLIFVQKSGYTREWSEPSSDKLHHPVTNILWNDAVAFCSWASEQTGHLLRLPTEAEWEKVARGTDGRFWPWGNVLPEDKNWCNFNHYYGSTTPVGQFSPRGDSPYGCADMSGNVDEWTSSIFKSYPYDSQDGREDLDLNLEMRVVRGGSYQNNSYGNISTVRRDAFGPVAYDFIGFRCACSM